MGATVENIETKETDVHPVDEMTVLEITNALVARFGAQRTVELFGWIFIIGPLTDVAFNGKPAALRAELENRGMKKSAIYRALGDFRTFGLELKAGGPWPSQDHTRTVEFVGEIFAVCSR